MENKTQNFVGTLIYFNISGMVHTPNGPGEGFSMNVVNNNPNLPAVASTVSQSDGTYALSVPCGWSGIVTAVKTGYIIVHPANAQYTYENVLSDQAEKDYKSVLERCTISGLIKYADGSGPVADVQLKDDANNVLATTDASGFYSFEEDYGWSAIVRPYKDNHVFDPVEREYTNLQSNQVDQHYKAKKSSIVISGRIVSSPNDTIVAGVVLKDNAGTVVATTDSRGLYSFEKSVGWSGMIIPSKQGYSFTPKAKKYQNVQTNLSHEDYIASTAWTSHH